MVEKCKKDIAGFSARAIAQTSVESMIHTLFSYFQTISACKGEFEFC